MHTLPIPMTTASHERQAHIGGPERSVGGKRRKVDKAERIERRQVIGALMANGVEDKVIRHEMKTRFGMTKNATGRLQAIVLKGWGDAEREERPILKQKAVKRILGHIASARTAKQWSAVASLERLLAEVQGTKEAERIEVSIDAEIRESVGLVVAGMSPERLAELADRALQYRRTPPPAIVLDAIEAKDEEPQLLEGNPVTSPAHPREALGLGTELEHAPPAAQEPPEELEHPPPPPAEPFDAASDLLDALP